MFSKFKGRKEMCYLMTHSTHFYNGVGHTVKDPSERGNLLLTLQGVFNMHHPTDSCGALAGMRNSSVGPP